MSDKYAFLFDLDGTLINTEEIYFTIWRTILAEYNWFLDKQMFCEQIQGNSDETVISCMLPNQNSADFLADISRRKDQFFLDNLNKIVVLPGAVEFVRHVKHRGHLVAIVSNCNRTVAEAVIWFIGLHDMVDTIVIGNECAKSKPYPDPYLCAIENLHTTNDRAIIFEDSKVGIQSGKNVFPKCLVGIETMYSAAELYALDVDFSIADFTAADMDAYVAHQNTKIDGIVAHIRASLVKSPPDSVEILPHKLKGGYISDVLGVKLRYDDDDDDNDDNNEMHCVLKMENKQESFLSDMAKTLQLYDREYLFYESIYPYVPLKTPKMIAIIKDQTFHNIGILMEDLNRCGFRLSLDLNLKSVDVSLRIIDRIARMHARFWGCDLVRKFPGLKRNNDAAFQPVWGDFIRKKWPAFRARWATMLTPEMLARGEHIVANYEIIQNQMSCGALTLIHGDVKSGNIFYESQGEDGSYEPYFIDWQYVCEGKGVQDLVFFMIESFDIEVIQTRWQLFRDYYYLKLQEYGVGSYSRAEYYADFENAIKYFPFFVAVWFGTVAEEDLIDKNFPVRFISRFFHFAQVSILLSKHTPNATKTLLIPPCSTVE